MSPGKAPAVQGGGRGAGSRHLVRRGGGASAPENPLPPSLRLRRVCPALTPGPPANLTRPAVAVAGQNEGTISVVEGETLYVIEEDKGDGWTRIRRSEDEEGYVPTSYVEVFLDKNAKGAKTYI